MMLTPLFIIYFCYFDFIFMLLFFLYTTNINYQKILEKDFIYYYIIAINWGESTHFRGEMTLEKPESATRNGQLKATSNIGYTRHRTKTTKAKHTTQKTEKMSYPNISKKAGVNPGARDD